MTVGASASASKSSTLATVGTTISLISKAQVRYEGALYTVDPLQGTVALANVHVHGTEGRPNAPHAMPALTDPYDYILFRGSDIQDLTVSELPARDDAAPDKDQSPTLSDPAIIRTSTRPPRERQEPVRAGGAHQYFHPDSLAASRPRSEPREERGRGQGYREHDGRRGPPREVFQGRPRPGPWAPFEPRGWPRRPDPPGYLFAAQPPQRVVFLPRGASRPPPGRPGPPRADDGPRPGGYRPGGGQGQRPGVLRRPVVMYARHAGTGGPPGGLQNEPGPLPFGQRRPARQRSSNSFSARAYAPGPGPGPGKGRPRCREYLHDYDFEKMNAELEQELRKEPEAAAGDGASPKAASPPGEEPKVNGDESPNCYDKTISFFDRISRVSDSAKARVDRADERRINEETFGRNYRPSRRGRRAAPRPVVQYY